MGSRAALASVVIYGGLSSAKRAAALELTVAKAFRQWRLPEELASEQSRTCIRLNVLVMTRAGMVLGAEVVKPRVLWRLVYLVPVVAGCDCSWRWWSWWVSGVQAASCSAGVRMQTAECGRVVLNQCTHSAVATSTASMSSQGPWLRISSALYKEFRASARAKPKGVALGTHRGDRLAVGQGLPVANGPVLHPTVASDAPGQRD